MKYIFFDIDGTLVGNSKQVTKNTADGIREARANGHKVYLCTGRAPVSIPSRIKEIGFDGVIASAGGFVQAENTYIYENSLDPTILQQVIVLFINHNILFSLETKEAVYQTPGVLAFLRNIYATHWSNNSELSRILEETVGNETHVPIDQFNMSISVAKISFMSYDKIALYDTVPFLSKYFDIVIFSKKDDPYINGELIMKDCTKGDGMKYILEHMGGSIEDTIAFGDSMNDYPLITAANYSMVNENAPDKLLSIADDTFIDPDQDGIYLALRKLNIIN